MSLKLPKIFASGTDEKLD